MSERIRRAGQVAWAVVGLVALLAVVVALAWVVRVVWLPLILGGAIVFLLNPGVSALARRGVPRVVGAALSYLAVFVVVGLAVMFVVPLAVDQADELSNELPEVRANAEQWVNALAERSENWLIQFPSVGEIQSEVGGGDASLSDNVGTVVDIGGRVFHVALIFLLAPIIAFYLLVDVPRLGVVAMELVPERSRREVQVVGRRLNRAIGGFFRGQLMVALVVGVIVSIGLAIIDLPFWLIIGMIAGLFNIIPLIGPWVGAVPGVIIALTTRDVSTALWVGAIMAGAQQVDNHFISPLVMQRAVKLHPAAVILALLAGGTLGGFFGLALAVPVAAALKILAGHLWRTYVLGQPIEEIEAEGEAEDAGAGVVRAVAGGAAPARGDSDRRQGAGAPLPAPAPEG
ncbi:MAG: AI-2E family transporter, partial [Acidimicrobiales bacterium]